MLSSAEPITLEDAQGLEAYFTLCKVCKTPGMADKIFHHPNLSIFWSMNKKRITQWTRDGLLKGKEDLGYATYAVEENINE